MKDQAINIITNTYNDHANDNSFNQGTIYLNPIEEIFQLHEGKIGLYERMLKEKDEMMGRLERLIGAQKSLISWPLTFERNLLICRDFRPEI